MRRRIDRGDRGASLLMVLVVVSAISLVMGVLLTQADTSVRTTRTLRDQTAENYAADAAVQAVLTQVKYQRSQSPLGELSCASTSTPSTYSFGTAASPFYDAGSATEPLNASATCVGDDDQRAHHHRGGDQLRQPPGRRAPHGWRQRRRDRHRGCETQWQQLALLRQQRHRAVQQQDRGCNGERLDPHPGRQHDLGRAVHRPWQPRFLREHPRAGGNRDGAHPGAVPHSAHVADRVLRAHPQRLAGAGAGLRPAPGLHDVAVAKPGTGMPFDWAPAATGSGTRRSFLASTPGCPPHPVPGCSRSTPRASRTGRRCGPSRSGSPPATTSSTSARRGGTSQRSSSLGHPRPAPRATPTPVAGTR